MLQITTGKSLTISLIFVLFCTSISAQTPAERKANRLYENYAYADAIKLYEYVLEKSPNNQQAIRNIAQSAINIGDNQKAEKYLLKLIELGNAKNEDFLQYAYALQKKGEKDKAAEWFVKYDKLMAADGRGGRFKNAIESYKSFFDESNSYELKLAPFNTSSSDFSVFPYNEGFIMVSGGNQRGYSPSNHPWNNKAWLDLFFVSPTGDPKAKRLSRKINSKYHEGPVSYSESRKQLAFTRNNFRKGKVDRSSDHINKLSIFFAEPSKKDFKNITAFKYNNPEYSNGHPSFSESGDKLFFSSDMPGGFGGSDIYVCFWQDSSWSEPRNLGENVNTSGNEFFPVMYKDSLLTFASDGWGGMGGLDVFYTEIIDKNTYSEATNPGAPINSLQDDFSWLILEGTKSGYVSSNRPGGKGDDDVYSYTYSPKASKVTVIDKESGKVIQAAKVEFFKKERLMVSSSSSDKGSSFVMLKPCNTYDVKIQAENYPEHTFDAEVDCPINDASELIFKIKQPLAKVHVYDKYKNSNIENAEVKLYNRKLGDKPLEQKVTDNFGNVDFRLVPGSEYEVIAEKNNLPLVSSVFIAPTKQGAKDVDIRLGTGIAPKRGVLLVIQVNEEQNDDPVNNAKIRMLNEETGEIIEAMTDQTGVYETVVKEGGSWLISTSRIGYFSTSKSKDAVEINRRSGKVTSKLKLLQLREGGIIALEGIFYDLDKADVRPDAAKVLDYVVQVMEDNPGLSIELGSHTDSQGKDDYNMKLSERRAASASEYIVGKGVSEKRIVGKGYGESRLKNKCANGVKCTDAEHQENRRTEIRILDVD